MPRSQSLSTRKAFPHLNDEGLRALELISSPIHIYSFTTNRICWSNAEARRFWLAPSDKELLDREVAPHTEAANSRLDAYRDAFRRGEDRLESWTFYPKGQATTALCRCSGVRLDGHDEAMLVEIQSLSETELPVSELRSIEALRHTPLMITLFSEQGTVLMRNPAAQVCFNQFDLQVKTGANPFRSMFADPADAMLLLEEARKQGSAMRMATMAVEGWPVHNLELTLVNDPATGQSAMLVSQQDVSLLIEIGRQLAASEDALHSVLGLNVIPALVVSVSDGLILQANHAAGELLGSAVGSGSKFESLFANPGAYQGFRSKVLSGGAGNETLQMRRAPGGTFWVSVAGARINYLKHDSIVILITDIDALYRATDDLEAALGRERLITSTQRRFLAIASHEFRTPLAIIDSAAQRLERGSAAIGPDQIRSRANRIRTTVRQLLQLLDNTIEQARDNQGSLGYTPVKGDLADCIRGVARSFTETNPTLTIDLQLPQLPELTFDRLLIAQAFGNLFANSVKYSGGPARVEVKAIASSEDVQIFFRDWGNGIPADEWGRVFSEYVRGSNADSAPGTGLGLSIVRQAIGMHGGLIEIIPTEGPGTTFKITLPRP